MATTTSPRPTFLGTLAALWTLSRPRGALFVPVLPLLGYGFAHWDRALVARNGWGLLAVLGAWLLLHAGALWLNAALDRDEGEVLFGKGAPVPPGIELCAYGASAFGVALAAFGNPWSGVCALGCAILGVLYSHRRFAWKAHPVGGPFVNLVGYGLLSPLAGVALVDVSLNPRTLSALVTIACWIVGWYFAAQAFQQQEDRQRGYRTLVATHGSRIVLYAARLCMLVGTVLPMVLAVQGWFPRITLAALPLFLRADAFLALWTLQPDGGSEAWARGLVRRLALAGSILVALEFVEYARESFAGEPVAGLGTAAGHPSDRPVLPPWMLREIERQDALSP